MGVALGAQVGHVDAYRASLEGCLIYTVFTKKCQKRSKTGYPLFGPPFAKISPYQAPPRSDWALGGRFGPRGLTPRGPKPHFEENF